ncbi:flagellar hook capping FlgD N-terminal domain-containing protein [Hyphococcus flavus]|uniref:Basal-body rod modification protein FlgD n=1 Tax=Hyphococcus flavus TaxID=1866326 RepID=A0AAE9ZC12_9PROT|nr:flagellar hook capping FlgD N-terminal domain-containing protein [Hyphococcus flavus]WDI31546.1 flagellar hook capping FlgD N-terminal domain-containing protein [Hyphococcus flavus]
MQAVSPTGSTPQNQQSQSTAAAAQAAQASASETESKNTGLNAVDFQNFLTLLTAQLKNQDPLDPADSTEFVAQLAQFSSVEQLVNANNKLDSIADALGGGGNIDKYASWIGKQAEATDAPAFFDGDPVKYRLSGSSEAAYVQTVISDRNGAEIARFPSVNSTGVQTWNGLVNGAPAPQGAYAVNAIYYAADGTVLGQEAANTFGGVREVRLNAEGEPSIVLDGGVEVTPDQITGLGALEEEQQQAAS